MDKLFTKALGAIEDTINEYPVNAVPAALPHSAPTDETARRALAFWRDVALQARKATWDEQATQVADLQEGSLKSRKRLAELTKEFRSGNSTEADIKKLIPSYQSEVDSLTKRAKFAEGAFLGLYRLFYDAEDPTPALSTLELRASMGDKEVLIARVQRLEQQAAVSDEAAEARIREAAKEAEAAYERERQAADRERLVQRQLADCQRELQQLQQSHESVQSMLFSLQARADEDQAVKQADSETLLEENELLRQQVLALEKSRDELSSEFTRLRESAVHPASASASGDSMESYRDTELKALRDEVTDVRMQLELERSRTAQMSLEMQDTSNGEADRIRELERQLDERPTVAQMESLRKQVRMLQALVDTEVEDAWGADEQTAANTGQQNVTQALQKKNRQLTAELTTTKVALDQQQLENQSLQSQLAESLSVCVNQRQLLTKLEEDLLHSTAPSTSLEDATMRSDDAEAIRDKANTPSPASTTAPDANSMLSIVCGQRDRFRASVLELQADNNRLGSQLSNQQLDLQRLRTDNVQLYEKIRFLQRYQGPSTKPFGAGLTDFAGDSKSQRYACFGAEVITTESLGRRQNRYACFGVSPGLEVTDYESGAVSAASPEVRYKKMYEERINPFAEFSRREQEQSYSRLRLHDKITLRSSRFFLSNPFARLFLFCYTIILHLLVFGVLYRLSTCGRSVLLSAAQVDAVSVQSPATSAAGTLADRLADAMGTILQSTRTLTTASQSGQH
eukprot:jgi/Chlat1/8307/Chrsp78S07718